MNVDVSVVEATEEVDRRGLATIQKVLSLTPIKGKDRIELAEVQGYKAIVQKGLHKVGDLVLVVRYDSVLPKIEMFEFMKDSKYRVKVKSFSSENGRVYSQVIVIPLAEVKKYLQEENIDAILEEESDLTTTLKVTKFIVANNSSKCNFGIMKKANTFPIHMIDKTDEISIQSKVSFLDEIKGKACYLSEKVDGSSSSFLYNSDSYNVCSRNIAILEEENNAFWYVSRKYNLKNLLASFKNYAIQGELCGPKILNNKLGLDEYDLYIFNIIDLEKRQRIAIHDALRFCEKFNLKHVKVVEIIDSFNYTLDELIQKTFRKYEGTNNQIEGLVLRTQEYCYSRCLEGDSSVKIMNPAYSR